MGGTTADGPILVTFRSERPADKVIQAAATNINGLFDGLFFITGHLIQATFQHPVLPRAVADAILTSRMPLSKPFTHDHLSIAHTIGAMAEIAPPLAHALRDFRIASILPPEDGIMFLWRSIESILWYLAEESKDKTFTKSIPTAAEKLKIDARLFEVIKKSANHQTKFGRHAIKAYRRRLQFLEGIHKGKYTPLFFTQQMASNDDGALDFFPVSFTNEEWKELRKNAWTILFEFIRLLGPQMLPYRFLGPW